MTSLNWKTAVELAQGYRSGRFSPLQVLADCLAQADRLEPALNALVLVDRGGALAQAEASAARHADAIVTAISQTLSQTLRNPPHGQR